MPNDETATLGGGCFWCLDAVYREMDGVESCVSGYMGGHVDSPTYQQVCTATTGHAEVVQLRFRPDVTTYREILEVFFATHDPTTKDRQGNDVGPQYRSVIFWDSEEQKKTAEEMIRELTREEAYGAGREIVTEVVPAQTFWPAEDYHQNYRENHPMQPYCMFVVAPKLRKFREKFAEKRRSKPA